METKYTSALTPVVMLVAAVLHRRPLLWMATAVVAAQIFVSWELITALLYGDSHFLLALRDSASAPLGERLLQKMLLAAPMINQLGGIGWPVILVGLAGLGVGWRGLAFVASLVAIVYGVMTFWSFDMHIAIGSWVIIDNLPLENCLFFCLGQLGLAGVVLMVVRLAIPARSFVLDQGQSAKTWLLMAWLAVEVLGYFPLTPFPAVRRVYGVLLVLTLMAGSLAARSRLQDQGRKTIFGIVVLGSALGFFYYGVDLLDAWTTRTAALEGAALARSLGPGDVWYVGHWGFQFYSEAAAMKPVVVEDSRIETYVRLPAASLLHQGDWIVVPDGRVVQQTVYLDPMKVEPVGGFALNDLVPFKTVMCYYGGSVPLQHRREPTRLEVTVYRVLKDCTLDRAPTSSQ